MRTAVDTNVLSAIWGRESNARELAQRLAEARRAGSVAICGVVFAEALACPHASESFVREFLATAGVSVDFDLEERVWVEAGTRYAAYAARRRVSGGGEPKRLLADFIVGAHALVEADQLISLDRGRYERDFPELKLVG